MKKELRDAMHEKLAPEARERMFRAADTYLDNNKMKAQASFWSRLISPAGGLSLAAGMAAAVGIYVVMQNGPMENQAPVHAAGLDPDLVRNIDLLLELDTLEKWEPGAGGAKDKWPKKKT